MQQPNTIQGFGKGWLAESGYLKVKFGVKQFPEKLDADEQARRVLLKNFRGSTL